MLNMPSSRIKSFWKALPNVMRRKEFIFWQREEENDGDKIVKKLMLNSKSKKHIVIFQGVFSIESQNQEACGRCAFFIYLTDPQT